MHTAWRTAAWLDAYPRDLKASLHAAAADGFPRVTVGTLRPELDPRAFGPSARQHLRRYVRDLRLELEATAAVFPGAGLADPREGEQRLARLDASLRLAAELGAFRSIVNVSGWSEPGACGLASEALERAAALADRYGVPLAVQTRTAELDELAQALDRLNCPTLALALDTGGLTGAEPLPKTSAPLGAVVLRDTRRVGERVEETVLGQGELDLHAVLGALAAVDYRGGLTIRVPRSASVDAMRLAREYVAALLPAE